MSAHEEHSGSQQVGNVGSGQEIGSRVAGKEAEGRPAEPLRFGVTAAGLVFTHRPAQPEDAPRTLALLRELAGPGRLVVRVNRLFWSGGDQTLESIRSQAARYAREGFDVSLQLRYGGPGEHLRAGGPDAFAGWTREVIRAIEPGHRVIGVEITNEPNLATAPDNSDGAFDRVGEALVGGVMAASEEATRQGGPRAAIGFNWFHHTGDDAEEAFWRQLQTLGGERFAACLDWVGLNVYPGTYDFSDIEPGREGTEIERALARLRDDLLPIVGVPPATPIRVIEFGWPDGTGRTESQQAEKLAAMVTAIEGARERFNVTDAYWFNLRDSDSSQSQNESHYGLAKSDYSKKASFEVLRRAVHDHRQSASGVDRSH